MMAATPWDCLLHAPRRPRLSPGSEQQDTAKTSKAGMVRALLQDHGPMTAHAILMDDRLQIESAGQLWACMKWDIQIGRISVVHGTYRLNDAFDNGISKAMALLRRNGYTVDRAS